MRIASKGCEAGAFLRYGLLRGRDIWAGTVCAAKEVILNA